ncbi:MAG: aminotransferase class V-fold PLP-dependent enzyme [Pseudomonadota bacterium]
MTQLDLDFTRSQFPAFAAPAYPDHIHFDNAGGSFACAAVIDRLTGFYRDTKVQPYGPGPTSTHAGAAMDEAKNRLSAMFNVAPDELAFGPSTTQNAYVLAQAFRQMLVPGEAIIVTNQDHEANTGPWRGLAETGTEVREWRVDPDSGTLDTQDLIRLLDGPVRLVCMPHCSNILGVINPVAEWSDLAHDAGAVVCVDGVSAAPHGFPDMAQLGADIYLFSAYKTYGPHQGLMILRHALADRLPNQGHYFNSGYRTKRFTPAGPDHAQVAASAGMADYIDALYAHHFPAGDAGPADRTAAVSRLQRGQESKLLGPLLDYLSGRNDLRLLGPHHSPEKVGTVAVVPERPAAEVAKALVPLGIMADGGDFYAVRLLEALGVDPATGVLRLSFTHYNRPSDIDAAVAALDQVL